MILKNYIRANGTINIINYPSCICLMVDTRRELNPEDWDATVNFCYQSGYELHSDEPDSESGPWEFWHMYPILEAS